MVYLLQSLVWAFAALPLLEATTLTVSSTNGNASSPILYGLMFEDINNSGDGGLHGQLLQNNGFQPGYDTTLTAYAALGGATISIDPQSPLTSAITNTLRVTNPSSNATTVGFSNSGYDGVPVNDDTYQSYVWIKGDYSGNMTIALLGPSGITLGSTTFQVQTTSSKFIYYSNTFTATQSVSANNTWQITYDASLAKGGFMNFGLPQLFPVTYHQRFNGLRNDVATFMEKIGGSFLRFPGGNNLEGNSIATRWKWNETIGPVEDRPGRMGTWGYPNTDALGLMEYLQWTEDMVLENVLAVWSGHALNGESVSGDALDPYIDEIMNELEFLLGSTSTQYGAVRARYGRSDPYTINLIEIGNEDNLSGGCSTYASRFTQIYDAIHAAYPSITLIASTTDTSCLPNPLPSGTWTDIHYYLPPDSFVAQFNEWDNWPRTQPIFVGEYGSTTNNAGATTYWTNMMGSCSEAVYMIGMERNSDVVKMASFAPLLEHFDRAEWSPDLFGLDSSAGSITGSTSYYVQQMFASNRGATILPVSSDTGFGPLYFVASSTTSNSNSSSSSSSSSTTTTNGSGSSSSSDKYFVKIANYGNATEPVTVKIPDAPSFSSAELQLLSSDDPQNESNYPHRVSVTPQTSTVSEDANGGYTISLPPYAVAVLILSS